MSETRIAAVDGETDLYAVPLEDHGRVRVSATLYFLESECPGIPLGGDVEIDDR
jgi:hypothetical protein